MLDLSLHLLDLLQNCAHAGATKATVEVSEDFERDILSVAVSDDGRGMDAGEQRRALDPFYSSQSKRVGLGLPMIAQAARMAGGTVSIDSAPSKGTTVKATFSMSHVDRQPMGDLAATAVSFLAGNPGVDLALTYRGSGGRVFKFDSFTDFPRAARESIGQIGFLCLAEEKLRAGLACAGYSPDGGGVGVEVHRGSGTRQEGRPE